MAADEGTPGKDLTIFFSLMKRDARNAHLDTVSKSIKSALNVSRFFSKKPTHGANRKCHESSIPCSIVACA